jgi:hypothetical protein
MIRTKFTPFVFTLLFLTLANLPSWAQPFRTVTFTGNAFSDFTSTERSATLGGGLSYEITWDATKLYLGVSAPSSFAKDQPTILYIDTDPTDSPTAGTGSTLGQDYDGRKGTLPFTANVVFYMKAGYAEMRVFSGGVWNYQANLTTSTYLGANDLELGVSWTDFPGGVRPAAMRYTFFKENGGGGTDAYHIYPDGTSAISGAAAGGYIGDLNSTPFGAAQYIYIANTNSGAHTANTMVSDCPTFALSGSACLPLALTVGQNTGNNTYNVTLNNATTAQTFVYTASNTGAAATSYNKSLSFQPATTTPLPAGNYTISAVTLNAAAAVGASPLSCPNSFSGTGAVTVSQSAPAPTSVTPTQPTGASNGKLTLAGLIASATYSATYQLNGAAATTVNGLIADATGNVIISNLSAGTYTNISVTSTATTCGSLAPLGPVVLTSSCGASAGTFPW